MARIGLGTLALLLVRAGAGFSFRVWFVLRQLWHEIGGAQSLHTNARDEALGLPTEQAALLALHTQQVIACETAVPDTVDPLCLRNAFLLKIILFPARIQKAEGRNRKCSLEIVQVAGYRRGRLQKVLSLPHFSTKGIRTATRETFVQSASFSYLPAFQFRRNYGPMKPGNEGLCFLFGKGGKK